MANRYWVGGGSSTNWSATSNTNWSATSGGANNASVPGTGDFCIFDANSGTGTSNLNGTITVQGVDASAYAGTITQNATLTINTAAANAFKLGASMLWSVNSSSNSVTFTNTSGTAVLTSAGQILAEVVVNGAGGTVQQADDLQINAAQNSILTITTGTFDCNSHALTAHLISSSGGSVRGFILGSGLTIGGNVSSGQTIWNFSTTTNLTFTKNSCNIAVLSPTTHIAELLISPGSLTYNGWTFNATTSGVTYVLSGANTFGSLSVGAGNTLSLPASTTQTISSAFTITGTGASPVFIGAPIANTATLSVPSGACTLDWGLLYGITGSGGATFTATNSYGLGSISGWTITPPADAVTTITTADIWQDLLSSSDFTTSGSIGALLKAASNLQYTVPAIGRGTVTSGASTTSVPTSAFTPATSGSVANQLAGRVVLFDAATTTTALRGQTATISASSASATPTLTVSTLTATPASGDTFSVI